MKVFETMIGVFVGLAVLVIVLNRSADVSRLATTGGGVFSSLFSAVTGGGGGAGGLAPLPPLG